MKNLLLDQSLLAGLGNIQATEALFLAGIHPSRPGATLSLDEARRLTAGIHETLERTLALDAGREEITYVEEGASNPFRVYGRAGEPCPRCRLNLDSLVLGGRASVFCLRCQR